MDPTAAKTPRIAPDTTSNDESRRHPMPGRLQQTHRRAQKQLNRPPARQHSSPRQLTKPERTKAKARGRHITTPLAARAREPRPYNLQAEHSTADTLTTQTVRPCPSQNSKPRRCPKTTPGTSRHQRDKHSQRSKHYAPPEQVITNEHISLGRRARRRNTPTHCT